MDVSHFLNGPTPALFNLFLAFQKHYKLYNKYVHPVHGAGIRTHDLWNMSLLPLPLD